METNRYDHASQGYRTYSQNSYDNRRPHQHWNSNHNAQKHYDSRNREPHYPPPPPPSHQHRAPFNPNPIKSDPFERSDLSNVKVVISNGPTENRQFVHASTPPQHNAHMLYQSNPSAYQPHGMNTQNMAHPNHANVRVSLNDTDRRVYSGNIDQRSTYRGPGNDQWNYSSINCYSDANHGNAPTNKQTFSSPGPKPNPSHRSPYSNSEPYEGPRVRQRSHADRYVRPASYDRSDPKESDRSYASAPFDQFKNHKRFMGNGDYKRETPIETTALERTLKKSEELMKEKDVIEAKKFAKNAVSTEVIDLDSDDEPILLYESKETAEPTLQYESCEPMHLSSKAERRRREEDKAEEQMHLNSKAERRRREEEKAKEEQMHMSSKAMRKRKREEEHAKREEDKKREKSTKREEEGHKKREEKKKKKVEDEDKKRREEKKKKVDEEEKKKEEKKKEEKRKRKEEKKKKKKEEKEKDRKNLKRKSSWDSDDEEDKSSRPFESKALVRPPQNEVPLRLVMLDLVGESLRTDEVDRWIAMGVPLLPQLPPNCPVSQLAQSWTLSLDEIRCRYSTFQFIRNQFLRKCPGMLRQSDLYLFGSLTYGLAMTGSDIDVALCGNKELSKSATQKALGFVTSMAFRMGASEARVPIVKFNWSGVPVDMCFRMSNTRQIEVFRDYASKDPRFRVLCLIVKKWARARNVGDASQSTLSSYCWVMLVLHYLSTMHPLKPEKGNPLQFRPDVEMPPPVASLSRPPKTNQVVMFDSDSSSSSDSDSDTIELLEKPLHIQVPISTKNSQSKSDSLINMIRGRKKSMESTPKPAVLGDHEDVCDSSNLGRWAPDEEKANVWMAVPGFFGFLSALFSSKRFSIDLNGFYNNQRDEYPSHNKIGPVIMDILDRSNVLTRPLTVVSQDFIKEEIKKACDVFKRNDCAATSYIPVQQLPWNESSIASAFKFELNASATGEMVRNSISSILMAEKDTKSHRMVVQSNNNRRKQQRRF